MQDRVHHFCHLLLCWMVCSISPAKEGNPTQNIYIYPSIHRGSTTGSWQMSTAIYISMFCFVFCLLSHARLLTSWLGEENLTYSRFWIYLWKHILRVAKYWGTGATGVGAPQHCCAPVCLAIRLTVSWNQCNELLTIFKKRILITFYCSPETEIIFLFYYLILGSFKPYCAVLKKNVHVNTINLAPCTVKSIAGLIFLAFKLRLTFMGAHWQAATRLKTILTGVHRVTGFREHAEWCCAVQLDPLCRFQARMRRLAVAFWWPKKKNTSSGAATAQLSQS